MSQRGESRRARREKEILDAATTVFGALGYRDASMDEIAAGAGLTKPMLYFYFGSKEELFFSCVTRAWERMGAAIFQAATQPGAPDLRLWRGILAYFEFVGEHRAVWRVVYPELAAGSGDVADRLRERRQGAVEMMAGLFAGAVDEAGARDDLADMTVPTAYGFVGAATAIAAWWIEHPEQPAEVPALRLMNLVWTGFAGLLEGELWQPPR